MIKRNIMILGLIIITIGLFLSIPKTENKFKREYERLNNKKNQNGKYYKKVNIPEENPIVYSNYEELFEVLDKTGVIYFGFPECPWCRNAVPILMEAAKETGVDKIYYLNNLKDRNTLSLKDGKIITEKEGTKNYDKLLKKIGDNASVYEGLEDENIKRLYFPTVITVKNGEIQDYIVGTVDSQKDPYNDLTKKEAKELKDKYVKAINKTLICNTNEKC